MAYLPPGSEPPLKGKGSKISTKMSIFVDEYLVDLNASKAVIRAGYKTTNPNRIATELLRHPLVLKAIQGKQEKRRDRLELSADYVITKLISIVEDTEQGNPQAALRGLELLGKHLGLYRDRQEISGPDGGAIEMEQKVKENVDDFTSRISRLSARSGTDGISIFPVRSGKSET